jgi:hypothetical protein
VREKDDYMFLYESYYLFSYIIDISMDFEPHFYKNQTNIFDRTNRQLIKMKQVRETSYLTILRPTLEYAAMVCDPTT